MTTEKSAKELAFLHDLYVASDWGAPFAELIDKSLVLPDDGQFLYVEAGTGAHALELREKLPDEVELFCTESDEERLKIARSKAVVIGADVRFQQSFPNELNFPNAVFSHVVCDASFLRADGLAAVWKEIFRVTEKNGYAAMVLPTAGSFGDFFSVLWESLYELKADDLGVEIEKLISELPTVSDVQDTARAAGFREVAGETNFVYFDYENGGEFLRSPLIQNFLYPLWTNFIPAQREVELLRQIEKTIDAAKEDLSFRLTVKMTLVTGLKKKK